MAMLLCGQKIETEVLVGELTAVKIRMISGQVYFFVENVVIVNPSGLRQFPCT